MISSIIQKIYKNEAFVCEIDFTVDGYFNATQASKAFGKLPKDWLKTKETKEYIEAVLSFSKQDDRTSSLKTMAYEKLVIVKNGSPEFGGGTWLHPDLVIMFARWLNPYFAVWCDQQIKEILKQQQSEISVPKISHEKYKIALEVAKTTAELLNLSETSKLRMMYKICEEFGVDTKFLPYYIEQNPTGSLTQLLKYFGLSSVWTAQKLNLKLEELGILEKMTRKSRSSPSGEKQFWSLTSKGLKFGKNESSAQNPRETQPLYFKDSFLELMKLI